MEIRFYHLTRTSLEQALPKMLERTIERGQKSVVRAGSEERVEFLNGQLWTYGDGSFLPHGSAKDGFAADQPIWLTAEEENPNEAQILFLTDGAMTERLHDYELCVLLFDGKDPVAVATARDHWRNLKNAGHSLTYWQQDDRGRWEKKS